MHPLSVRHCCDGQEGFRGASQLVCFSSQDVIMTCARIINGVNIAGVFFGVLFFDKKVLGYLSGNIDF